ncbi:MAG: hypothetical protein IJI24_02940 [Lachnospiraceae bacterium]|nr:hypothetical protein [Lachnospiraceae bacterium]
MKKKKAKSFAMQLARQISQEPKADRKGLAAAMTKVSDRAVGVSDRMAKTGRRIKTVKVIWKVLGRVL